MLIPRNSAPLRSESRQTPRRKSESKLPRVGITHRTAWFATCYG
jgi:hypothetical protein